VWRDDGWRRLAGIGHGGRVFPLREDERRRLDQRARDEREALAAAVGTTLTRLIRNASGDEKCLYSGIETNCNVRYVLVLPTSSTQVYPLKQASKCVEESAPRNKPST
jgi:hypothetical protein